MGRVFLVDLDGRSYGCRYCNTPLALAHNILSRVRILPLLFKFNFYSILFFFLFLYFTIFILVKESCFLFLLLVVVSEMNFVWVISVKDWILVSSFKKSIGIMWDPLIDRAERLCFLVHY